MVKEKPAPPEHNTPNTGRVQKYQTLVEPGAPRKRDRSVTAALVAAGFALASLADKAVAWLT